jgi:DGQHR domain-containing protein
MKLQAIRIRQKGAEFYVTVMKAGDLLSRKKVDQVSLDNPEGYQRPLLPTRLKQVLRYLTKEEGVFDTTVVLNIRQEDLKGKDFTFTITQALFEGADLGSVDLPDDVPFWLEDGQHRVEGIEYSIQNDGQKWLTDYPLPVTLTIGNDRYAEMRGFYLKNTRQHGVPVDVTERHLLQMESRLGTIGILEIEGDKKLTQTKAVKVVDLLRTTPGQPWYQTIVFPGEQRTSSHIARQHTIVSSLLEALRDQFIRQLPEDQLAKLVANYWNALKELLPEAFQEPPKYSIQKTAGLYSLHMMLPDVVELCREARDFSKDNMKQLLSRIDMDTEFWSVDQNRGDPLTFGTGMKSLRILAHLLREQLPKATLVLPAIT